MTHLSQVLKSLALSGLPRGLSTASRHIGQGVQFVDSRVFLGVLHPSSKYTCHIALGVHHSTDPQERLVLRRRDIQTATGGVHCTFLRRHDVTEYPVTQFPFGMQLVLRIGLDACAELLVFHSANQLPTKFSFGSLTLNQANLVLPSCPLFPLSLLQTGTGTSHPNSITW
jgi:hypothetical protein